MERKVDSKFYEFNQNNSGGRFDVDEDVCHRVIIEALSESHAISLFEPMIENQSGSCPCCGDRWNPEYAEEIREEYIKNLGYDTIEEYYQHLANDYRWTVPDARIHFLDGTKKEIFKCENI